MFVVLYQEDGKENPARLFTYNNRVRQMKDEAEKPTKSGDDLSGGSMVQH